MRYFIFYYAYTLSTGETGFGYICLKSNRMLSHNEIEEQVNIDYPATKIVITGFNEFKNEEDYDNFRP